MPYLTSLPARRELLIMLMLLPLTLRRRARPPSHYFRGADYRRRKPLHDFGSFYYVAGKYIELFTRFIAARPPLYGLIFERQAATTRAIFGFGAEFHGYFDGAMHTPHWRRASHRLISMLDTAGRRR